MCIRSVPSISMSEVTDATVRKSSLIILTVNELSAPIVALVAESRTMLNA